MAQVMVTTLPSPESHVFILYNRKTEKVSYE